MQVLALAVATLSGSLLAVFAVEEGTRPSGSAVIPILVGVFVVSFGYWVWLHFFKDRDRPGISALSPVPLVGNVLHSSTVNVTSDSTESAEPKKQVASVTSEFLRKFYEGRTRVQGDRLLAPYLGKLMRMSGRLEDVRSRGSFIEASFEPEEHNVQMFFAKEAEDDLGLLERGTELTVVGRISSATQWTVTLDECVLEDA